MGIYKRTDGTLSHPCYSMDIVYHSSFSCVNFSRDRISAGFCRIRPASQKLLNADKARDSFTLATKLHGGFFNSFDDRDKVFNEQLEQAGEGHPVIHGGVPLIVV